MRLGKKRQKLRREGICLGKKREKYGKEGVRLGKKRQKERREEISLRGVASCNLLRGFLAFRELFRPMLQVHHTCYTHGTRATNKYFSGYHNQKTARLVCAGHRNLYPIIPC